ncbi:MAG: hypothetical protein EOP04_06870 [Proteobacteria bacterium]|nr:MAG: hypothetical protein EOP04_06870 [Pseudomonadota bacterium]
MAGPFFYRVGFTNVGACIDGGCISRVTVDLELTYNSVSTNQGVDMRFIAAAVIVTSLLSACKKDKDDDKDSNKKVLVKASALQIATPALQSISASLLSGPESPDYANGEYDGMGVSTSDAVVEGFKITLTSVSFGSATSVGATFPIENGELDIAQGVNSTVTASGDLASGNWDRVNIQFKPSYKLKAYAYMDSDNDGTIDRTVFTTATAVQSTAGRLTKAQMDAAGYAEYAYGFAYTYCSDSVTASVSGSCGMISVFPEPFSIDAPIPAAEDGVVPQTHVVNILIDSTKVVSAWLGSSGSYRVDGSETTSQFLGDPAKVPEAVGFPLSNVCSDTLNRWNLNSCDFFPIGTPAFKLNYIPAYAFLSTSGLTSQVYAVSTEAGIWNHYDSGTMQFVLKSGVPILGLNSSSPNGKYSSATPPKFIQGNGPLIGSVSRLFEGQADSSYRFYMDGRATNDAGVEDGGLYYNNDKSMAGFVVEGFKPTDVDGTQSIVVSDGPRCSGEYDSCIGARTYYLKRIK